MSSQPIETHDEPQVTDPAVRERLMAACEDAGDLAAHVIRRRVIENARSGLAEYFARHGL